MHTRIYRLTLTALVGLAVPAAPTEYEASDYLPLAAGNSWTFHHGVYDYFEKRLPGVADPHSQWPAYAAHIPKTPSFTITVERTEEIDGKTYYVLSDMPSGGWPPAPPHFLAGKKLRWKGTRLMERTDTGEQSLFRFDGPRVYTIPTTEGDNEVQSHMSPISDTYPVPEVFFRFFGYDGYGEWPAGEGEPWTAGRHCTFLAGYGLGGCTEFIRASDYGVFANEIDALGATLVKKRGDFVGGGEGDSDDNAVTVSYRDARRGRGGDTSSSSPSWGEVKQSR